jgi:NADH dehydrogenase FAD-containing subunit
VVSSPKGKRRLAGFLAYQLWRSTIFSHLVSPRNKILVLVDRMRARIFGRDMSKF